MELRAELLSSENILHAVYLMTHVCFRYTKKYMPNKKEVTTYVTHCDKNCQWKVSALSYRKEKKVEMCHTLKHDA